MRGPRTARDAIINSLRSALREELTSFLPVGTSRGTFEYIREGYQWHIALHLSLDGSKKTKLISQRRLNQKGDKGVRG